MEGSVEFRLNEEQGHWIPGVPAEIIKRQIALFYKCDPEYGQGVAARLGLSGPETGRAAAE